MTENKLEAALSEIQTILIEYGLVGLILVADENYISSAKLFQAEWNNLIETYDTEEAILPTGCDFDLMGHSQEAENTINMISALIESMEQSLDEVKQIQETLIQVWESGANNN